MKKILIGIFVILPLLACNFSTTIGGKDIVFGATNTPTMTPTPTITPTPTMTPTPTATPTPIAVLGIDIPIKFLGVDLKITEVSFPDKFDSVFGTTTANPGYKLIMVNGIASGKGKENLSSTSFASNKAAWITDESGEENMPGITSYNPKTGDMFMLFGVPKNSSHFVLHFDNGQVIDLSKLIKN